MVGAIIILLILFSIVAALYKNAESDTDKIIVTLFVVALIYVTYHFMPWVFTAISRRIDQKTQRCYGILVSDSKETKCFGAVKDK